MGRGWASSPRSRREGRRAFQVPGLPATHPPVQVVDEVTHVVGQDDSVLAHVAVVPQHAHRHVGRHLGKLPENVVEGPEGVQVRRDVLGVSCDTTTRHFARSARSREGRALGSPGSRLSRPPFLGVPLVRCLCTPCGARLPRGANTWCEARPDPETATGHDADTHARADRLDFIFPGGAVTETVIKGPRASASRPGARLRHSVRGHGAQRRGPGSGPRGPPKTPPPHEGSEEPFSLAVGRLRTERHHQQGAAAAPVRADLPLPSLPQARGRAPAAPHTRQPHPPPHSRPRQWSFLALGKGRGELRGCRGPTQSCALADSRRGNHL